MSGWQCINPACEGNNPYHTGHCPQGRRTCPLAYNTTRQPRGWFALPPWARVGIVLGAFAVSMALWVGILWAGVTLARPAIRQLVAEIAEEAHHARR